ncbi:MAG TPA: DUF2007 domain-containing protein [Thermoclostridium sp.]
MKRVSGKIKSDKEGKEVFLVTAADEREYDVYKSLLEAYGIPFVKRPREAGGYLNISMGMNVFGSDIYVPEKYYEDAAGLIRSAEEAGDGNDKEMEEIRNQYQNKRLAKIWIIIAVFYFVPLLLWLIYSLVKSN